MPREGTRASWLFEILRPHVATIVVEHVTQSRGPKSDAKDAHALAERLRTGGLGPCVFKDRTCRQFWSYCGPGIVTRSSSDWVRDTKGDWKRAKVAQTCGLSTLHNSALEHVFEGAATTVIAKADSPLKAYYERSCRAGTKPNLAKVSLARKIAAIALAMWKHGKEYSPPPVPTP